MLAVGIEDGLRQELQVVEASVDDGFVAGLQGQAQRFVHQLVRMGQIILERVADADAFERGRRQRRHLMRQGQTQRRVAHPQRLLRQALMRAGEAHPEQDARAHLDVTRPVQVARGTRVGLDRLGEVALAHKRLRDHSSGRVRATRPGRHARSRVVGECLAQHRDQLVVAPSHGQGAGALDLREQHISSGGAIGVMDLERRRCRLYIGRRADAAVDKCEPVAWRTKARRACDA